MKTIIIRRLRLEVFIDSYVKSTEGGGWIDAYHAVVYKPGRKYKSYEDFEKNVDVFFEENGLNTAERKRIKNAICWCKDHSFDWLRELNYLPV